MPRGSGSANGSAAAARARPRREHAEEDQRRQGHGRGCPSPSRRAPCTSPAGGGREQRDGELALAPVGQARAAACPPRRTAAPQRRRAPSSEADDARSRSSHCSSTLCGCCDAERLLAVAQVHEPNEPAPQPPTGLSENAPAASFHHTQRLPEFVETSRAGSYWRSCLTSVNACQTRVVVGDHVRAGRRAPTTAADRGEPLPGPAPRTRGVQARGARSKRSASCPPPSEQPAA